MKKNKFYSFLYPWLAPFFRFFYRIEIRGKENEPTDGGLLVCANHISNHDVIILAASLKHQLCFLAKKELFKIPLVSSLIRALGAFPIDRKGSDVGALKKTVALLEEGRCIGMYPQGTRFPGQHPRSTPVKPGVGLIAVRSGCSILPVSIQTKGYKVLPFKKTVVTIGKPITAEEMQIGERNSAEYERISRLVFDRILEQMKDDSSL